ncbi:MAG: GNAT family N-acetyltransferase [Clostridiaceae bacterium]|nr:GNAT family N-acetyltransferase [Clostridiaceae bacterium]
MIEIIKSATLLPPEWDELAGGNFALNKNNLMLLEKVNPCDQSYVIFRNSTMESIFVSYKLKLNILCYSVFNFYLQVVIIGIPCSVSECGYSFSMNNREEIKKYLKSLKGGKLILNSAGDVDFLDFSKGFTLPTCKMDIPWNSFDQYMAELRSHYRYRYKKAMGKSKNLLVEKLEDKTNFTSRLYHLYEEVYNKSEYKLEKLPIDFFKRSDAHIITLKYEKEPIAFVQYTVVKETLVFLFGGLEYDLNEKYDLYLNMLLLIIRVAIENNCTTLNLGQTAEEIKCKLGAFQEEKYLYIHHSNPIIHSLIAISSKVFSYKMKRFKFMVLKGENN